MTYESEIQKSYELLHQSSSYMYNIWLKYVLLSWQWWAQLALTIIPWVIWIIFRKKESTHRLLYAGVFVMFVSSLLDVAGIQLGLWQYRYELLPMSPSIAPWDLTLIPVAIMLALQINPLHLNRYIKALIFSAVTSFLLEPLFHYIGYYKLTNWKYIYSFPITALLYLSADWLSRGKNFKGID